MLDRLVVVVQLAAGQATAQSPRVHFLGIADTDAKGVGTHVQAALSRTSSAMLGQMPSQRYKEHPALVGPTCDIDTIKQTVQMLPVVQGDTVIIYYAGHGSFDRTHGTLFMPERNPGRALRMRTIMELVERKQPHLLIMLVDVAKPRSMETPKRGQKWFTEVH